MESPPPHPSYQPKKKSTGLIITLIIGGVAVCCIGPIVLLAGAGWWGFKTAGPMITCGMAVDDIQEALHLYAKDHSGKLPNAATWQDDVKKYYVTASTKKGKDGNPFKTMSADSDWGCDAGDTKTGFAFNSDLSGKKLDDIKDKSVMLVFEVPKTGHNLAMKYTKQDPNTSPKLFNERRGWFVAPVEGETSLLSPKGNSVHITTGSKR